MVYINMIYPFSKIIVLGHLRNQSFRTDYQASELLL